MRTHRVVWLAGVVVLVLLVGAVTWRLTTRTTTFEDAVSRLPASTLRTTYTDWAQVRSQAGGEGLDPGSSERQVRGFLNRAYDRDLTSGSAISDSTSALSRLYGFSPLDAQWEALGQSREGQVDVVRVDDDVDLAGVERALRRLGYTPPAGGSGSGGTWAGGADLVARISPDLTPVQQNVVVLPDEKLVLMSDNAAYASAAADSATGDARSLSDVTGIDDLADAAATPVAATMWSSTFACEDLSMGSADEEDQRVGDDLVAKAGEISPLAGLVMAQQDDRTINVGLQFENDDQASENLQPRVDLASGDAPGQGGSFSDRFTITSGTAQDSTVLLQLRPKPGQSVLSDLSSGPVLFATC
ncbi:MAG: hypothetical protein HOQ45_08510 [Nocardioidaceae bacterium]|nr:hypothetical protein [Nocardioidaceae bacterium]